MSFRAETGALLRDICIFFHIESMKKPHSLKAGLNAMLILLIRLIKNEYALSIMK